MEEETGDTGREGLGGRGSGQVGSGMDVSKFSDRDRSRTPQVDLAHVDKGDSAN